MHAAVQMAWGIAFTKTWQINRENGVLPGKRFQIQAPRERSAQQPMQQHKRRPRSRAKVAELLPVNLSCKFVDLHSSQETTAFPFQALKLNVIASVASGCGVPPRKPRNFLTFLPLIFHSLLRKNGNTKSHMEILISVAFYH